MTPIRAWAAMSVGGKLERYDYDPDALPEDEVEIDIEYCGICHSDLSMIDNEWHFSAFPLIPGHEAIGRIVAAGPQVKGLKVGQRVGVGWTSRSCLHCAPCIGGDQHLCGDSLSTITHRGGFADRVRCQWPWAIPLPEGVRPEVAGPLYCGGITVFSPLMEYGISPTSRIGVVGIGGLGHMAIKFARAWGAEVTAFTSTLTKRDEAMAFGAHRVIASNDPAAIKALTGSLDLIIVAVNVPLDWPALMATLAPRGRLHFVGAVLDPIALPAFALIGGQKSLSGSPTGSPASMAKMLAFCARHGIEPQVEHFPMSRANEALDHLRAGKARYRIVLDADWPDR
jgi:alcohol/geraniol dehydrogenase (NADP+)